MGSPPPHGEEQRRQELRDWVVDQLSTPLPKDEEMLRFLYGDGTCGSGFVQSENHSNRTRTRPSEAFRFVSPVFLMESSHPSLMPGARPAVADAELDLAHRPVIAMNYVVSVGVPGVTYEFGLPTYVRYLASDRTFEMDHWDEGGNTSRRAVLDPWERHKDTDIDLDVALDELGELDRTDTQAPAEALSLSLKVLANWFKVAPITVAALTAYEGRMVTRELKQRGVWVHGPPPWSGVAP